MNVFTDFHHASLLQSLIILFEKRLGRNVYRPIGMEWAEKGFWKVYDHPATQLQYLGIGSATPDGTPPLNEVVDVGIPWTPGIYSCHDIDSGTFNKAITFEAFMRLDINIVIASIPQHVEPFKKLCELHRNKPKLIYQIGNQWDLEEGQTVNNIMASSKVNVPADVHAVIYHQEFDTNVFRPNFELLPKKNISSFVNVFNGQDHFKDDYNLFLEIERLMPEWEFKSYGGQCRDGAIGPAVNLAETMRRSRFIWHTKQGGDGYGHIIHNAPAVARPLIVKRDYYINKMAEPLLIDGETCLTIDGLSPAEIVDKINYYNAPAKYDVLCRNAYFNFNKVVNFDQEFEKIKVFLENLK